VKTSWFIVRKAVWGLIVFLVVSFLLFSMFDLLSRRYVSPHSSEADGDGATIASFGLRNVLPLRFARWLAAVASGRFGVSVSNLQPFSSDPLSLPPWPLLFDEAMVLASVTVFFSGLGMALLVGGLWGALAVAQAGILGRALFRWCDRLGRSVPGFLWAFGLLLVMSLLFFGGRLGLRFESYPTGASLYGAIDQWPAPALRSSSAIGWRIVLSWLVIALPYTLYVARRTAEAARHATARGWPQAALARGASRRRVAIRYLLRPSFAAAIGTLPHGATQVLCGSLIAARVLGLPTFDRIFLYTLRHLPRSGIVLSGLVTYVAVLVVVRVLSEVLVFALDPRLRRGAGRL